MTTITNLLAFFALGVTLVLVWRQSWRGRVRLFVVQSVLLGALAAAVTSAGTPHGKNRFASSVRNTRSFMAEAHSIMARWRPEYSSTMAS